MSLVRWRNRGYWDPFADIMNLRDEVNRLFGSALTGRKEIKGEEISGYFMPAIDVVEDKDSFVLKAELPGIAKDDIQISFRDGTLILKGEKKHEEKKRDENYYYVERVHGSFYREIDLPSTADAENIKAVSKDGVLEIRIPKKEEAKPKRIEIELK